MKIAEIREIATNELAERIEAEGVSYEIAKEALRLAAQKLPITTKFVVRRDYDIQNQNA